MAIQCTQRAYQNLFIISLPITTQIHKQNSAESHVHEPLEANCPDRFPHD